jgi:hypothetical protein
MSFTAAIDISTFIWSRTDYDNNKNQYYKLLKVIPSIYEKIKFFKTPVLIRQELYNLIMVEFPYIMAREISYEFELLTLSFLTETFSNWIIYTNNKDGSILSIPVLAKPHFSNKAQAETQKQIHHLFHNGKNPEHKFIAYNYFFNQKNNLVLKRQKESVEIDTLCYNSEKEIQDFFESNRIKFEHNPKHKDHITYANGEKISPFSCYHKYGEAKAQEFLEKASLHQGDFYYFDDENSVYVKFVLTTGLIYHGFDLSDSNNYIPNEIKKKFNKSGKVF